VGEKGRNVSFGQRNMKVARKTVGERIGTKISQKVEFPPVKAELRCPLRRTRGGTSTPVVEEALNGGFCGHGETLSIR